MMKRFLTIAVLAAMLSSCLEQANVPVKPLVKISIRNTKAASGTAAFGADDIVSRTTIYVMEPSESDGSVPGNVVDIVQFSGDGPFELETTIGPKYFFVVANGPDAGSPANYQEVKALEYSMSSMSSAGSSLLRTKGPLMTGLSGKVTVTSGGNSASVSLSRRVFRVNIASVKNCLPENYDVKIQYAYLSNYVSNCTLGNVNSTSVVYGNSRGRNQGVINGTDTYSDNGYASIAKNLNLSYLEESSGYDGIGLHALPNSCTSDTWSSTSTAARKTRLVLVASLDGSVCYYPITLEPLAANTSTDINITLYNIGSPDPETEPAKGSMEFDINVFDWYTNNEETYI